MVKVNFKKNGSTTVNVATAVAILGILILFGLGIGAAFFGLVPGGENAPKMLAGAISCSNWNEPFDYQDVFTKAAGAYGLNPAIIATMFSSEHHTTSWPDSPRTVKWASSPVGASGPFQFMPATWRSNGVDATGDGKKDIQNIEDSAFGAARYIQASYSIGAGKRYTSTDKADIQVVAGCYNAGCGRRDEIRLYATTGDDSGLRKVLGNDYLQTKNYMDKAWEYFQIFNNGCASNTASSGNKFTSLAQVKMLYGPTQADTERLHLVTVTFLGHSIKVNKVMVTDLQKVEQAIKQSGVNYPFNNVAGYFYRANANNSADLSPHAFGLAIDIYDELEKNPNAARPTGSAPRDPNACTKNIPDQVAKAFKSNGFFWGAEYETICDPMHFQYGGNWQ